MKGTTVLSVALRKIRTDGGTQMREHLSEDAIAEYAEDVKALPPAVVYDDGESIWLADGFHRHAAFQRAGKSRMLCEVREGSLDDAILYAAGANADHGLRRTNADKRRAVEALLSRPEWAAKSDRWIAKAARVSDRFVNKMRVNCERSQLADTHDSPPPKPATRTGQDGKKRKAPKKPAKKKPLPVADDDEEHDGSPPSSGTLASVAYASCCDAVWDAIRQWPDGERLDALERVLVQLIGEVRKENEKRT